jgi:PAS domain S-box-containing protein
MGKAKILVVEDEAIIARDLVHQLKELGYEPVAYTAYGEEALRLAEQLQPDLALMDMQLAGSMDGVSTAKKLRERFSIPVVFLTAYAGEKSINLAKQAEPFGYVLKPFEPRELQTAIEIALYRYQAETRLQNQQEAMKAILNTTMDGYCLTDMDGHFLEVNDAYSRMTGYSKEELLQMSVYDMESGQSKEEILENARRIRDQGAEYFEGTHRCRDGRTVPVELSANYLPIAGGRIFSFLRDITERKRIEEERLVTLQLLELINGSNNLHGLMQSATLLLRDWSGCEAVGIRLRQKDDYPYFETRGFPPEFVAAENYLCMLDPNGVALRNSDGNPLLECMCGNILCGRFDPAQPFFTQYGSFWSNSTTMLLATTTDADRKARTRNRCNGEGYESVALIPLRVGSVTYGLVQVNDHCRDRFSPENLSLLERLASSLALAVAHRLAQEDVRKSESRFRTIADYTIDWESWMGTNGRLQWVNPAVEKTTGYTANECLAMADYPLPIASKEDREEIAEKVIAAKAGGRIDNFEFRILRKDGSIRWGMLSGQPIYNETGQSLGYRSSVRDITDRKDAEDRLITSEAELMAIYENVPILMCLLDEDRRVVRINTAGAQFAGVPESELLGRRGGEILGCLHATDDVRGCGFGPTCDRCQMRMAVQKTIDTGERCSVTEVEVAQARNGKMSTAWLNGSTARLDIKGQTRVLLCIEDVSERRLSTKRVEEQAALLDVSSDCILVCDLDGRVQYMNRSAEELTGRTLAEARQEGTERILNPRAPDKFVEAFQEAIAQGVWNGELLVQDRLGKQVISDCRWALVRDPQGAPRSVLMVNSDVTARKQLEAQYLRAQRLESLGVLASGIAHDLNNVLSPLLMGGSILESSLKDKDSRAILKTMTDAARRGADTVKQLLTFARGSEGKKVPVRPRHLLQEVGRLLQQTLPKNIQVYTDFVATPHRLMADPTQLHQVLMNLCVNARDAMPDGGVLSITAENTTMDESSRNIHPKAAPGDYVLFKVADTGSGIAPEAIDRIFDPFFTTKPQGKGTGLGLATTLGIVEGHGGFILVDNQPDSGTVFRIYLPAMPQAIETETESTEQAFLQGQGEHILIVDDEQGIRSLVHDVLIRNGYQALVAGSVPEALELFRIHRNTIRVVLTDMMMPFVDGRDLVIHLRTLNPSLKIIAFSGLATDSIQKEVMALGANAFLHKPVETNRLLSVLHELLETEANDQDR